MITIIIIAVMIGIITMAMAKAAKSFTFDKEFTIYEHHDQTRSINKIE